MRLLKLQASDPKLSLKRPTTKADLYKNIDFRLHPELYRVGRGQEGVLTAEPYKSELLPSWRFRTPTIARFSAQLLYLHYLCYRAQGDAVGMNMALKYIWMGYTRSMRYGNRRSGKKYDGPVPVHLKGLSGAHGRALLPRDPDPVKVRCAAQFKPVLDAVRADPAYQRAVQQLKENYRG